MLGLLTVAFGLNLLDRQIVNILAEPIKLDLNLADWQVGALSGPSFALLYSVAALPIARSADRMNRVRIVGAAVLAWSVFTASCGLAGNFAQLLMCRIGVGIGEAGGAPPSQSLITDSYPAARRAGALAVFALGSPIGASIGLVAGGMLAGIIGWRWSMACAGFPGVVVGLLVLVTLRDPARSRPTPASETPRLHSILKLLLSRPAFMLMAFGSAMLSFVNYGAMAFAGSFYLRDHQAGLQQVSDSLGLAPIGLVGAGLGVAGATGGILGAVAGGQLGDRYGITDARALALIPAGGSALCAASYWVMFTVPSAIGSIATFAAASFFSNLWYGPGTLGMQRLAGPNAKATALAVALFLNSVVGLTLGPLLIGVVSDLLAPRLGSGEALRAGVLLGLSAGLFSTLLYWLASCRIVEDIYEAEGV